MVILRAIATLLNMMAIAIVFFLDLHLKSFTVVLLLLFNCLKNVHHKIPQKKLSNKSNELFIEFLKCLPQNGIPSGDHCPLSQTRLAGPNSSNPRSHVYVAIVPLSSESSENSTVLWAGEPGKLHVCATKEKKRNKKKTGTKLEYGSWTVIRFAYWSGCWMTRFYCKHWSGCKIVLQ